MASIVKFPCAVRLCSTSRETQQPNSARDGPLCNGPEVDVGNALLHGKDHGKHYDAADVGCRGTSAARAERMRKRREGISSAARDTRYKGSMEKASMKREKRSVPTHLDAKSANAVINLIRSSDRQGWCHRPAELPHNDCSSSSSPKRARQSWILPSGRIFTFSSSLLLRLPGDWGLFGCWTHPLAL